MPWSSLTSTASFVLLVLLGAGVVQAHGIDVAAVWRSDGAVFSDEQLARIEPILKNARCKDLKVGCAYSNAGRLVTRDELLESVWRLPAATVFTRTVDMHVSKLRAKVEADRATPRRLVTVYGAGYMLRTNSNESNR